MKVFVACEESQAVTKAFRALGHEAYSCDIQPCSGGHPEWHLRGDVFRWLTSGWDLIIAHPPCTYLSNAGARWLYPKGGINKERYQRGLDAKEFFMAILNSPCPKICVENPLPSRVYDLPRPTQIINPYEFGHAYSKKTLLWLKGLPPLMPTELVRNYVPFLPSNTGGKKRGTKYSFGIAKNSKEASKTFPGIAKAMANQWGGLI